MRLNKPFTLGDDGHTIVKTPNVIKEIFENSNFKNNLTINEYEVSYGAEKMKKPNFCLDKAVFPMIPFAILLFIIIVLIIGVLVPLIYFIATNSNSSMSLTNLDYNEYCIFSSQCNQTKGLDCISRQCKCHITKYYNGYTCHSKGGINASCATTEACDYKNSGLVCISSKCECYEAIEYYDSSSDKCVEYIEEGVHCDTGGRCNTYLGLSCKRPGGGGGGGGPGGGGRPKCET